MLNPHNNRMQQRYVVGSAADASTFRARLDRIRREMIDLDIGDERDAYAREADDLSSALAIYESQRADIDAITRRQVVR